MTRVATDTLRGRMGWLHRWVGFLGGLVILVIFAGGTLTSFDTEIGRWMQPEIQRTTRIPLSDTLVEAARARVETLRQQGQNASIDLPTERDPVLRIRYGKADAAVKEALDPETGDALHARQTVGGQFFYDLHFTLDLGHDLGRQVVDCAGIALLVAIGSGLVIHLRSLFSDLLIFRPFAARPRAWMDLHVLSGILVLPFLISTAYTGVVAHSGAILPDLRGGHQPPEKAVSYDIPDLRPILAQAERIYGPGHVGSLLFGRNGVTATRADSATFLLMRDEADFSPTGELRRTVHHGDAVSISQQAFRGVHFARWVPLPLRWMYFGSGLAGAGLMTSGLILFLLRYRRTKEKDALFAVAETLAMTVILGFPASALFLLWMNRLLPIDFPMRSLWEWRSFFAMAVTVFTGALIGSFRRKSLFAWRGFLAWIGCLGLALPLLDSLTRPGWTAHLGANVFVAVDVVAALAGVAALYAWTRLPPGRQA